MSMIQSAETAGVQTGQEESRLDSLQLRLVTEPTGQEHGLGGQNT